MANIKSLDYAPKFRKLVEAGCDVLPYEDGRVTERTEMPPPERDTPAAVGVRPSGRP